MSKSIIQLLKDNWVPFGGWPEFYGKELGEEMQEKALELGFHGNFRVYVGPGFGGIIDNPEYSHAEHLTYCLRPDYQPEQEIEECEIRCNDSVGQFYFDGLNMCPLSQVLNRPDLIGFKFESGQVEFSPIVFKSDCSTKSICQFRDLAGLEVLHATHVLFLRRQK